MTIRYAAALGPDGKGEAMMSALGPIWSRLREDTVGDGIWWCVCWL